MKEQTIQTTKKEKTLSTQKLVMMAMFTAILCVSAYISIPLPNGSHITFLNFVSTLIALLFPAEEAALIIFIWLLLGAIGIPVFIAGGAGIGYLLSPWGGYSIAFLFVALLLPIMRKKQYNRIWYTVIALISMVFVNLFGMVWLMILSKLSFTKAFIVGFIPFIPLDCVKAVVVAQIIPAFRKIIPSNYK